METWFSILGWFLTILTITGNGFIIYLLCKKRQLRTKTNAFVVSLAVADFCVGMIAVPSFFFSTEAHLEDQLPADWEHILRWLFMDASVTNMCSLVLDRYMAVVKPLKYLAFMKHRRVMQMISLSWAIPVVFVTVECSLLLSFKIPAIINVFIWLVMTCFVLAPSFMLIFCFASMLCVVSKHHRASRTLAKQLRYNHHALHTTQEKTAVITMAVVIGVFLLCSAIHLRCGFLLAFNNEAADNHCSHHYFEVPIVVLNSAANPLAYALFKRDIKKELKRLICTVIRTKTLQFNVT